MMSTGIAENKKKTMNKKTKTVWNTPSGFFMSKNGGNNGNRKETYRYTQAC